MTYRQPALGGCQIQPTQGGKICFGQSEELLTLVVSFFIAMQTKPSNLELVGSNHPFKKYASEFIVDNFGHISQRKIARILGIGKTTVNKWAEALGYKFKKHTSNENYFHKWSMEMAYIFGFICADGNVAWDSDRGYNSLTITASAKDKDHLEKIRRIFKSTKPLLYAKSTNSYRLIVNSKTMCCKLMSLGVVPRKSLILKFPKVPPQYIKDFIRGYVDGDGSLRYFARERSPYFELSISSGSKTFLEVLENKINKYLKTKRNVICYDILARAD